MTTISLLTDPTLARFTEQSTATKSELVSLSQRTAAASAALPGGSAEAIDPNIIQLVELFKNASPKPTKPEEVISIMRGMRQSESSGPSSPDGKEVFFTLKEQINALTQARLLLKDDKSLSEVVGKAAIQLIGVEMFTNDFTRKIFFPEDENEMPTLESDW